VNIKIISPKNKESSDKPSQRKNGYFLEDNSRDFDYITVIYGEADHSGRAG
jgi:hypothetical protein